MIWLRMLVRRKWGLYVVLLSMSNFKVKLLWFKKDGEISLQRHAHRNEVWCFLFGEGLMRNFKTKGEDLHVYKHDGDYTIVPVGNWHHYKAHKPTLVLEIQTGECREDDIERVS